MTVVHIPYVPGMLRAETALVAATWSFEPILHELDASDDHDYGRHFADWWETGETFIIVEQDIVATAGQLAELDRCPYPWCFMPYDYMGRQLTSGFGCVKFSGGLTSELRYVGRQAAEHGGLKSKPVHWRYLDTAVYRILDIHRRSVHVHMDTVQHLHYFPSFNRASGRNCA